MANYVIGTRGSLLALTQCGQIKDELEKLTGDTFELKVLKTQGDQIVDKPLWQLEGKDFFTKELDHALLTGEVDLVVHSYKDLGSERPEGITLAAITKRTFAGDILLIKNEKISKIREMENFVVGTSSPRRITNVESRLAEFLPTDKNIKVSTKILRGNVNTRIERLLNDEYDAIVLAHAGIERLAKTDNSLKTLKELLKDLNFMVMPQTTFPSAASQGALAIECLEKRDDGNELYKKLKQVEDKKTVSEITRERHAFKSYGGGCHLAVGIHVKSLNDYYLHIHAGNKDEVDVDQLELEGSFPSTTEVGPVFIGLDYKKTEDYKNHYKGLKIVPCSLVKKSAINTSDIEGERFVATSFGHENISDNGACLYTAGTKTWKRLAKQGLWVNASSDSLGESEIELLRSSKALEIMRENKSQSANKITLLSHKDTHSLFDIVESYKREITELGKDDEKELLECKFYYWTSFSSYKDYTSRYPQIKSGFHMCGLGKTLEQFKKEEIQVRPFIDIDSALKWISTIS